MKLTDNEIVKRLANRLGWYWNGCNHWAKTFPPKTGWTRTRYEKSMDQLISSRDAIAPILESLSGDEWFEFMAYLTERHGYDDQSEVELAKWLLTMPTRDLAEAIAEAIGEKHEKGGA